MKKIKRQMNKIMIIKFIKSTIHFVVAKKKKNGDDGLLRPDLPQSYEFN